PYTTRRTTQQTRPHTYVDPPANPPAHARPVTRGGRLSSRNRSGWRYPAIPDLRVDVPAHATRTVTLGPLPWRAGPSSYWWPNVPYRHGYRAQLHDLALTLDGRPAARYRFGFREFRQV